MSDDIPNEFKCPISMMIMDDPIILECGHTFDRDGLNQWLEHNDDCPTCRSYVNRNKITTNYSLKSMIENFKGVGEANRPASAASVTSIKIAPVDNRVEAKIVTPDSLKAVNGSYYEDSEFTQITLNSPFTENRAAISFVCVIDVSGSMGSIVGAGEGGKAFTRLDLVKHVLNVLIVSLTEYDMISLISYSTETKLICDSLYMTEKNKKFLKARVQSLQTENSTYTGQAIQMAYEVSKRAPENCLKSIILLTDGQDSEGYSILERKFTKIEKDPRILFNTFGISNDLWSDLLEKLATIGGGIFGFIPDQSMIGTIFINFIANTFQIFAQNVHIQINTNEFEFVNKLELTKVSLKYGGIRNFLLKRKNTNSKTAPVISIGLDSNHMINIPLTESNKPDNFDSQRARYKMLELCYDTQIGADELYPYEIYFKKSPNFLKELKQGRDDDQNNEQISLGIKNWKTWGAHYIRSFKFAHLHEQCLNFKSPSMKIYVNEDFDERVDKLTDIFCTLPPPKPTGIYYGNDTHRPKLVMRNLMDADAGCLLGSCSIKMAKNKTKKMIELKKGDKLEDGSEVICVLKTKFHGEMVKIKNLFITPYHPIIYDNKWQLPIDVLIENQNKDRTNSDFEMIKLSKSEWVCTLILNKNHIMNVEGFKCISLGHGFTEEVLKHDYYGTKKVIENLKKFRGWQEGEIALSSYRLARDAEGCVESMIEPVYARA